MKTKADKHRDKGTLAEFRARQAASRAGTARHQERMAAKRAEQAKSPAPTDTEMLDWLEADDGVFCNIDRITAIVRRGFNGHTTLREAIASLMS